MTMGPIGIGVWAFNVPTSAVGAPPKPQTAQAFNVGGPGPSAEWWTITLCGWRAQNGVAREKVNVFTPGTTKLQLELSGGGEGGTATEVVLVDYPQQGAVFSCSAVSLRGTLQYSPPGANENPPLLSGWVARGQRAGGELLRPTFTTGSLNIAVGGTTNVVVPARARMFRYFSITGNLVIENQFSGSVVSPVQLDVQSVMDGTTSRQLASASDIWFPLHPDTASISFANLSGLGQAANFCVQFALEL